MTQLNRAVFIDRDGVLIKDGHALTRKEQIEFFDHAAAGLGLLRRSGFKLILVTNQTVVAKGLLAYDAAWDLNQWILAQLAYQDVDAEFDRVMMCPHHPSAEVSEYRIDCDCRKPKSGMLTKSAMLEGIDLSKSFMIGDRPSDVHAGKKVGCQAIQIKDPIRPSAEFEKLIETTIEYQPEFLVPDLVFSNFFEAAKYLGDT
ncbi:MAG TPA: HAD-IIIA family hydrolase [Pseudobdellovibrionaceae bacterium]|nr:HAD-IIIA family hydrolase [Pseudobdellovibrionaceae bacterium]